MVGYGGYRGEKARSGQPGKRAWNQNLNCAAGTEWRLGNHVKLMGEYFQGRLLGNAADIHVWDANVGIRIYGSHLSFDLSFMGFAAYARGEIINTDSPPLLNFAYRI